MAQALSEEEFERMQAQLLELRTQNYQLSDELRKNTTELNGLRQRVSYLDKEFAKAQKEVDALLSENEMLQGKLHSQEDDFRLQNSTLMQELSKLCSQIEQLEKDNQILQEGKTAVASEVAFPASPVDGELLRLQAENSALQKNMAALQERYEKEVARQAENRGGGKGDGSPDPCPTVSETTLEQPAFDSDGSGAISQQLLSEVELKLQTEREEKILLKEQLQSLELMEKLKKKQESFVWLQTEKEALYNDSRTKIEEIQQRKEEELKSLQVRNQKLQQELQSTNQGFLELKDQLQSGKKEHELALQTLQDQIQTSKTQEMNLMREQVAALGDELQQRQNEKEALAAQRDDLNTQLQESLRGNTALWSKFKNLCRKKRLLQELDEAEDEMAIETSKKRGHKEELGNLRLQHEKEMLAVRSLLAELRSCMSTSGKRTELGPAQGGEELESMQQTVEELRLQIQSMDGTKGWFERRLKEAEESIEKHQQEHMEALRICKEHHAADLQSLRGRLESDKLLKTFTVNSRPKLRRSNNGRKRNSNLCKFSNQKLQQELQSTNQDQLQSGKKKHELALQTLQDQAFVRIESLFLLQGAELIAPIILKRY
ncbi:hypothetical protein E2320_016530 [Naja naja]|nr:hypothetical protein E2320_016530 [Naja naja]